MKIKNIAAICKKNKSVVLFERYNDGGEVLLQYIGDGGAVYPIIGLPTLDKESVLTIFDIPEKQHAYPRADGYKLFPRLHIRESRNPLRTRAASLHGRRRQRRRSSAFPFDGSYL